MGLFTKKTPHTAGEVDRSRLPRHIAVIMDGNGRWAKKRGLPRTVGHKAGAEVFRDIATYCKELGVEYLTVYAFSTENWKRPADEVNTIMGLLEQYLREAIDTMERSTSACGSSATSAHCPRNCRRWRMRRMTSPAAMRGSRPMCV